jgi:hypothetical protein
MSEEVVVEVHMDKMTKTYIKIRDKVSALTAEYDDAVEALKAQQQIVANAMKDHLQAQGGKSLKTEYGTVSLVTKTRYVAQDWDLMKRFVIENDAMDLLEKRIAQTNMAKFLEENPDNVPPGLNTLSTIEVSVRKPTRG